MSQAHIITFEDWARAKYEEVCSILNPCDELGMIDPAKLNSILLKFPQNIAWAITVQEIEANRANQLKHAFDNWKKTKFTEVFALVKEENGGAGRAPAQATVEARLSDIYGGEIITFSNEMDEQNGRVELLRGIVRVLERQASMLQTVSSNMRSELFFSGGVAFRNSQSAVDSAKKLLQNAIAEGKPDSSSEEES